MIRKILKYFLLLMIFMNGCLSGELNGADKKKVAVLNFEVNDKDVNEKNVLLLTDVLRNVVYEKLSNDDYMLMTQENIVALSEEPLEACIGVTCDVEIGRKLGAQYVITGKIMKIEDEYRLSLKMHDTTSGEMIGSKVIKSDKISKLENEIQGSAGKDLIKKLMHIENEVSDKLPEASSDEKFLNEKDSDNDNIPDAFDMCINDPEDYDLYEDNDGCPEDVSNRLNLNKKLEEQIEKNKFEEESKKEAELYSRYLDADFDDDNVRKEFDNLLEEAKKEANKTLTAKDILNVLHENREKLIKCQKLMPRDVTVSIRIIINKYGTVTKYEILEKDVEIGPLIYKLNRCLKALFDFKFPRFYRDEPMTVKLPFNDFIKF